MLYVLRIKVGLESVFHDSKIVEIQTGESVYLRPATGYLCHLYTAGYKGTVVYYRVCIAWVAFLAHSKSSISVCSLVTWKHL